jgi:hypothetical protein
LTSLFIIFSLFQFLVIPSEFLFWIWNIDIKQHWDNSSCFIATN